MSKNPIGDFRTLFRAALKRLELAFKHIKLLEKRENVGIALSIWFELTRR